MKSNYYFVLDLNKFSPQIVVYTVSVGSSHREQVKFALVREYCENCGMYFHPVSVTSDKAIDNLAERLFPGSLLPRLGLRRAKVTISQIYSMIIDDSFGAYENSLTESPSKLHVLNVLDPVFHFQNSKPKSNTFLPSVQRKNLKSAERESIGQAIIGFWLILVIYVIASMICSTELYY